MLSDLRMAKSGGAVADRSLRLKKTAAANSSATSIIGQRNAAGKRETEVKHVAIKMRVKLRRKRDIQGAGIAQVLEDIHDGRLRAKNDR